MHTSPPENSSQQVFGRKYGKEHSQNALPKQSLPHAVTAHCPKSESSVHHTKVRPEIYRKSSELCQIFPEIKVQEASDRQIRARGKITQHECLPALLSVRVSFPPKRQSAYTISGVELRTVSRNEHFESVRTSG